MTELLAKKSVVFWPEDPEESVAEKPIIIELYHDIFQIKQGKNWLCTHDKSKGKIIAGFVEWHEVNKIEIPKWCPVKVLK